MFLNLNSGSAAENETQILVKVVLRVWQCIERVSVLEKAALELAGLDHEEEFALVSFDADAKAVLFKNSAVDLDRGNALAIERNRPGFDISNPARTLEMLDCVFAILKRIGSLLERTVFETASVLLVSAQHGMD
jgi:hypothetical protein